MLNGGAQPNIFLILLSSISNEPVSRSMAAFCPNAVPKRVKMEIGIKNKLVKKVFEGRPNIVDLLIDNKISIVMNTTEGEQSIRDSKDIRQLALDRKIPYYTTARGIIAAIFSLKENKKYDYLVKSIQEYHI